MVADAFRDEHKAQNCGSQAITISLYKKTSIVSMLTMVNDETMQVLYQNCGIGKNRY